MSQSPKFHARAGSRASLVSVGQMPVIKEDSNGIPLAPPTTTTTITPTTPPLAQLRVPAKNPRRSLGPPPEGTVVPFIAGFQDIPPGALNPPAECKDEGEGGEGEGEIDDGDEETVVGDMTPTATARSRDGGWRPDDMRKRCRFALIFAVLMVVLVGLAIGLSIGLTNPSVNNTRASTQDPVPADMPTGTFVFDTTLQNSSAACTSSPSTWRCLSSTDVLPARFNWTIEQENSQFRVTSFNDPIASSFTRVPMVLVDEGQDDERFVFSFGFNVTFDLSAAENGRAAVCTYTDTTFQGTLWTRRGMNPFFNMTQNWAGEGIEWPGLMEIVEAKNATRGVPQCVDAQGDKIADVQAGIGACECVYRTGGNEP